MGRAASFLLEGKRLSGSGHAAGWRRDGSAGRLFVFGMKRAAYVSQVMKQAAQM